MSKAKAKSKGVALFVVLAAIFTIMVLGNITLTVMLSQSRLTHHQLGRMQGYYAGMAGIVYGYDKLRSGDWPSPDPVISPAGFYVYKICNGCVAPDIDDGNLPPMIQDINIAVAYRGFSAQDASGNFIEGCHPCNPPAGVNICVCSRATLH